MKSHERLSEVDYDSSLLDEQDLEGYTPKTRDKQRKKDFNKTYERKMRELMKEGDLAEKAARNMFRNSKSEVESNSDLDSDSDY